ncbi:MAG: DUF4906 domain-containing protein, partial [Dysgonomonas sp.]|nr:DUF4906 domain-containing protein [Dysgonomonas sp.]
ATHPEFTATYKVYLGADNSQNYNVKRNCQYTYTITLKDIVNVDSRVEVTPSGQIVPQAESNCYIVPPNSSIYIPVSRANKSALGNQINTNSNDWKVEILWQTSPNMLTLTANQATRKKGCFKVTTKATQGNAVVVVKKNDNTIIWSWHIWISTTPSTKVFGGVTIMDRNIGALNATAGNVGSFGLYYQWGRKDPFPTSRSKNTGGYENSPIYNSSGATVTYPLLNNNGTLVYMTRNPLTHSSGCMGSNGNTSWDNGTANYKTVYDPCPLGWRVPRLAAMTIIRNNASSWAGFGRNFTNFGWFPAVGWRISYSGELIEVGNRGDYWTSEATTQGNASYYLNFNSATIEIGDQGLWRPDAFPIRCVKE